MNRFESIVLEHGGQEYTVTPDRVLGLIDAVEEHLTMAEMYLDAQKKTIRFARLSRAYGAALRYAGCRITDDEIYAYLFSDSGKKGRRAMEVVTALMSMMAPPASVTAKAPEGKSEGEGDRNEGDSSGKPSSSPRESESEEAGA